MTSFKFASGLNTLNFEFAETNAFTVCLEIKRAQKDQITGTADKMKGKK